MENRYIFSILGIKMNENLDSYSYEKFLLSNDIEVLRAFFWEERFIKSIGELQYYLLTRSPFFWYVLQQENRIYSQKVELDNLNVLIELVDFLSSSLWLIKDNSVYPGTIFCYNKDNGITVSGRTTSRYSDARGNFLDTTFTPDEINRALQMYSLASIDEGVSFQTFNDDYDTTKPTKQRSTYLNYNTTNRVYRALSFVNFARSQSSMVTRIPLYIPIFESLFSTARLEITHQVCERVAVYLSDEFDRLETYKLLKDAYDFRSSYFHGDILPNKFKHLEEQQELSFQIDKIARTLLNKVLIEDLDKFLFNPNNPKQSKDFSDRLLKMVLTSGKFESSTRKVD